VPRHPPALSCADGGHCSSCAQPFLWPRNSWDLYNYRQRVDETLREHIQCFSKKRNEFPNITDADVINDFICGTTCEAFVHTLSHETPCTTRGLLDIATQYATSEEAIQANFSDKVKAAGHLSGRDINDDPALSQHRRDKRNKKGRRWWPWLTTPPGLSPRHGAHPEHFEKALEAPCPFHGGQVKHLLKDSATIKGYIRGTLG
jgi:hypothetical protein